MQVPHGEGVANHIVPESCEVIREGIGEALTGERIGQATEPRKRQHPGCRRSSECGRRNGGARQSRVPRRPGVVEDPGMCVRFLCGNREISRSANSQVGGVLLWPVSGRRGAVADDARS